MIGVSSENTLSSDFCGGHGGEDYGDGLVVEKAALGSEGGNVVTGKDRQTCAVVRES